MLKIIYLILILCCSCSFAKISTIPGTVILSIQNENNIGINFEAFNYNNDYGLSFFKIIEKRITITYGYRLRIFNCNISNYFTSHDIIFNIRKYYFDFL